MPLAELVAPKAVEVGTLAGAVGPMVVEAEHLPVAVVPKIVLVPIVADAESKAAEPAEVEAAPRVAELEAVIVDAPMAEAGPMVVDYLSEVDSALEVGPMLAGLAAGLEEESSHSLQVEEPELEAEQVELSPKEAVRWTDLELAPAVVLQPGPRNSEPGVAVLVLVQELVLVPVLVPVPVPVLVPMLESRTSQGQRGSLWENF